MLELCPMLDSPWVEAQRARYAKRDTVTPTEKRLAEMVAAGDLSDIGAYSLDTVCAGQWPRTRGQSKIARCGCGTAVSQSQLDLHILFVPRDRDIDRVPSECVTDHIDRLDGVKTDQCPNGKAVD